jgi:phage repressor protein C with HTH and peptisase S24 domain
METTRMKTIGIISTAALALLLGVPALSYAQQDPQDQKQEQKDKPAEKAAPDKNAKQEERNTQQEDKNKQQEQKNAQQQDRNTKQEEKSTQQQDKNNQQQQKNTQQAQRASGNHGGRIPDDRFQANFGRQHSFHVSQSDYSRDRRFEYGGYSFGFVDAWPSNWLYTEDVYVIEVDGVYYLCNASYPGVNIALSINL